MTQPIQLTCKPDEKIAGPLTVQDWVQRRSVLLTGATSDDWGKAFDDFLHQRLHTRYLKPISIIRSKRASSGEGFSIAAIQCTVIEFLAATVEGKNYRYVRHGDPKIDPQIEYSDSGKIFRNFLVTQDPFKIEFDATTARDFYVSVRCGLLHEARTKNGWSILAADRTRIIDVTRKIVFRNNLDDAISKFLQKFRSRLIADPVAQAAFVRKFDGLCRK